MADLKQLYKKAEEAFTKRNYDYARDIYLQIVTTSPDESDARKLLRATLKRKYQEQGAPSRITQKIKLGTSTATLAVQKDPKNRAETAQKYLVEDPENANMRVVLASALLELGFRNGALAEAEIAAESNPNNHEALKIMGRVYMEMKKIPEAQAALGRAQKIKPDDRDIDKLLKDLMANATMAKGFDEKNVDYRQALKNKDQAAELERAHHLVKSDDDIRSHLSKLMELHQQNPNDVKIIVKIGEAYTDHKKDYKTAQEWYKKAVTAAPHDSTMKDRVEDMDIRMLDAKIAAVPEGDPRRKELLVQKLTLEVKAYERRANDRPTDMQVRFELAVRYYRTGQTDKSIQEFQNAVKDPKRKLDAHVYLGLCFQKNKLYDLAEKNYSNAEEMAFVDEKKLQIWYNWGRCCEESGKNPKAIELYSKICEKDYNYRNGDVAQRLERLKSAQA
jgi:tetratricopeptide (TPR) repeat protein